MNSLPSLIRFAALPLLCFAFLVSIAQADDGPWAVSDPSNQAYFLGWALATPRCKILMLDKQVETLKELPSDPPPRAAIDRLDRMADACRRSQRAALEDAVGHLKRLGAPDSTYADAVQAAAVLSGSIDTAETAKVSKEIDPAIVRILATMDESDRVIPRTWSRLAIWLKLTHSPAALWSFRLGQLSASLAAARTVSPDIASLDLVDNLYKDRPADCPKDVSAGLRELRDAMSHRSVTQDVEGQVADAIAKCYASPAY